MLNISTHGGRPMISGDGGLVMVVISGSYPDPWNPAVFNLLWKTELQSDGTVAVAQVQEPF